MNIRALVVVPILWAIGATGEPEIQPAECWKCLDEFVDLPDLVRPHVDTGYVSHDKLTLVIRYQVTSRVISSAVCKREFSRVPLKTLGMEHVMEDANVINFLLSNKQ